MMNSIPEKYHGKWVAQKENGTVIASDDQLHKLMEKLTLLKVPERTVKFNKMPLSSGKAIAI